MCAVIDDEIQQRTPRRESAVVRWPGHTRNGDRNVFPLAALLACSPECQTALNRSRLCPC